MPTATNSQGIPMDMPTSAVGVRSVLFDAINYIQNAETYNTQSKVSLESALSASIARYDKRIASLDEFSKLLNGVIAAINASENDQQALAELGVEYVDSGTVMADQTATNDAATTELP